ncbi:hypothetical protein [Polycladidibacter hongkongensis]|uniref:hypothetical protein n=1 Tax=Polycladidibacter hongkongensis TaxID=1647556 RepID=UPI00082C56EF|nr:hypothetical protein [Pseudovibrio hongkongensis]
MADVPDNVVPHAKVRSLREAMRSVRVAEMERSDAAISSQEGERTRLELLCDELADVFQDVPEDDEQFSFQIVPGSQPRLWIDVSSHVVMARDHHAYRFVKDTRLGRVVLLESASIDDMADCITHYIAERILEKGRALEGDWLLERARLGVGSALSGARSEVGRERPTRLVGLRLRSFIWGAVFGAGVLFAVILLYFGGVAPS